MNTKSAKAMCRRFSVVAASTCALVNGISGTATADQFHYNNVILGERAVGLGGAYTAVADDASGVYYNPGGLAFALSNDISGSANAFYSKKTVYKNIKELGGKDFTETAGGTFAPPSGWGPGAVNRCRS